jgi:hypothetical protein
MAILDTFRAQSWGSWKSLEALAEALVRREPAALTALGAALGLEPTEQKELGEGCGPALADLVGDLKVAKGARLAAVRCVLEAQVDEKRAARLFVGSGDLLTDPRLGSKAKLLAETGLAAALKLDAKAAAVSSAAGDFARAVAASTSVLGAQRVKELLQPAPATHAGAFAARFALGEPLPEADAKAWSAFLTTQCNAFKKAPAAARRMGLVAPWPPFLPDAFAPLIAAADEATRNVATTDALAKRAPPLAGPAKAQLPSSPVGPSPAAPAAPGPGRPGPGPAKGTSEIVLGPDGLPPPLDDVDEPPGGARGTGRGHVRAESRVSDPSAPPPERRYFSQQVGTRAVLAPPVNRPSRPSTATLAEGPKPEEPGKRMMPAIQGRGPAQAGPRLPAELVKKTMDVINGGRTRSLANAVIDPLAVAEDLANQPETASLAPSMRDGLVRERGILLPDGRLYRGDEPLRFDPRGRPLPRSDRWSDANFKWQEPLLPPAVLRSPNRAQLVAGPFALRLRSLFEDRPEALDRLAATAEARAAQAGQEEMIAELDRELAAPRWKDRLLPPAQRARALALLETGGARSPAEALRAALALLLDRLPAPR